VLRWLDPASQCQRASLARAGQTTALNHGSTRSHLPHEAKKISRSSECSEDNLTIPRAVLEVVTIWFVQQPFLDPSCGKRMEEIGQTNTKKLDHVNWRGHGGKASAGFLVFCICLTVQFARSVTSMCNE
jgi:hypothetical protein